MARPTDARGAALGATPSAAIFGVHDEIARWARGGDYTAFAPFVNPLRSRPIIPAEVRHVVHR
jgi:hypothetical protein